ncbi:hypothetical protein [Variovorax sp. SRS16]|uniref:hypothetical protein n=1 Tax=Variovorax sp. SRS16 TaxID=282217 RepID=UPI0013A56DD0
MATLLRVCKAIGIRPGSLFDPPATNLVRAAQGTPISLGGQGMSEFLISGAGNEHMMALLSIIEPSGGSGSEPYTLNAASDLVHVEQGELIIVVDSVGPAVARGDAAGQAQATGPEAQVGAAAREGRAVEGELEVEMAIRSR